MALLDEEDARLKSFSLKRLSARYDTYVTVLDVFWMEIADKIQTLECLSEDPDFVDRRLAALVASKVHYHLESYDEALSFALGAEELFDVTERSEYVETIIGEYIKLETVVLDTEDGTCFLQCVSLFFNHDHIAAKCIDSYTKKRATGDPVIQATIDPRQEEIVNRMFDRCFNDGQFKQAMGIAIETRRMDMFVKSIR